MRIPLLWLWRLLLGGFAVVYLASTALQAWLPPLLPFLAAAAVEAQFFVAGLRRGGGAAFLGRRVGGGGRGAGRGRRSRAAGPGPRRVRLGQPDGHRQARGG